MRRRLAALAALAFAPVLACAQPEGDVDWREVDAPPPPPAISMQKLVPIELPVTELRYGVMPSSVAVNSDQVVRYVLVATSTSGAMNAVYEGIRCLTGEYKVYARYDPGRGWTMTRDAQWQSMFTAPSPRAALAIAQDGACSGHAAARNAAEILSNLANRRAQPAR